VGADWHLATLWETLADARPQATAITQGRRQVSWAEYDDAAARLAGALRSLGIGAGASVGLYLYNCPEYLIAQHATFKLRAVAVNVNYRYLDDELVYLLDDADAEALVFHASLGDRVERIVGRLPRLRLLVQVGDAEGPGLGGALDFDELARTSEPAPRIERPGEDLYMLYTGGTTGMPKGAMFRQGEMARNHAVNNAAAFGLPAPERVEDAAAVAIEAARRGLTMAAVAPCPLMHGMGMWAGAFRPMSVAGSCNLLPGRHYDPHDVWRTVERYRCTDVVIVGDPFARPMLAALDEAAAAGRPYDVASVVRVTSSGATFSAEVKAGLLTYLDAELADNLGSTEGGMGSVRTTRGSELVTGRFQLSNGARVLTEDGRDVAPGAGEAGQVHPLSRLRGYHKDPEKTARTVRVVDGVRYVVPGDWVTVDADGSIRFLGRGSGCINTAGEKVFPEEVEEVVKRHPAVEDCLVVGRPDPTLGEQVAAVASVRPGSVLTEAELGQWLRPRLSGYKIPRTLVLVDRVRRAPNGKADYPWARQTLSGPEAGAAEDPGG
jgi:3-oxocholest-4-en-26-oate---CoA ligase